MTENELDSLLRDWAARRELPASRVESLRAIPYAAAPAELSRQWWKDLFRGVGPSLRDATDPRRYLPAAEV